MRTRQRVSRADGLPTKWDYLWPAEMVALANTPFLKASDDRTGSVPGTCSECGADIGTEAMFAQHFIVPDRRYLNLGYCPDKDDPPYKRVQP